MDDLIKIDDYPQLSVIAWNRALREINGDEALALYERNWCHVDTGGLTPAEAALIERLKHQYGNGILNV